MFYILYIIMAATATATATWSPSWLQHRMESERAHFGNDEGIVLLPPMPSDPVDHLRIVLQHTACAEVVVLLSGFRDTFRSPGIAIIHPPSFHHLPSTAEAVRRIQSDMHAGRRSVGRRAFDIATALHAHFSRGR